MQEVTALIGYFTVCLAYQLTCFVPPMRATFLVREGLLSLLKNMLGLTVVPGMLDHLTGGEGSQVRDAQVNAYVLRGYRQLLRLFYLTRE